MTRPYRHVRTPDVSQQPQNVNHVGNRRGFTVLTPCAKDENDTMSNTNMPSHANEQRNATHNPSTTCDLMCGSLIRHERSSGECAQRLTTARTHNAFTTTPEDLHTRQHVVRATNHQESSVCLLHSPYQHSMCNERTENQKPSALH